MKYVVTVPFGWALVIAFLALILGLYVASIVLVAVVIYYLFKAPLETIKIGFGFGFLWLVVTYPKIVIPVVFGMWLLTIFFGKREGETRGERDANKRLPEPSGEE